MKYPVTANPYFCPWKSGLKQVAVLEYLDVPYEFDTRVVWQSKDGRLWTARDSGCSCPSPFEDVKELDRCFLTDLLDEYKEHLRRFHGPSAEEWLTFISVLRANGLCIHERDGRASDIIRMSTETALMIALEAIQKVRDTR